MTSFYYNYQNPWVCCFFVQIKAIVLKSSAALTNLNNKEKPKWILVVVVKYRHRAIVLLPCEQRLHFRGMSWRAKSSLCRQPFNFLSCMRKIRHAIRKQLVRQICVSFAGKLPANYSPRASVLFFCFAPSGFNYFSRKISTDRLF